MQWPTSLWRLIEEVYLRVEVRLFPCAVLVLLQKGFLVADFISPKRVYTFSSIGGYSIPKSLKCAHSATKVYDCLLKNSPAQNRRHSSS